MSKTIAFVFLILIVLVGCSTQDTKTLDNFFVPPVISSTQPSSIETLQAEVMSTPQIGESCNLCNSYDTISYDTISYERTLNTDLDKQDTNVEQPIKEPIPIEKIENIRIAVYVLIDQVNKLITKLTVSQQVDLYNEIEKVDSAATDVINIMEQTRKETTPTKSTVESPKEITKVSISWPISVLVFAYTVFAMAILCCIMIICCIIVYIAEKIRIAQLCSFSGITGNKRKSVWQRFLEIFKRSKSTPHRNSS